MRRSLFTFFFGLICLGIGLAAGVFLAPQLNSSVPVKEMKSLFSKVPGLKTELDKDSPYEEYNYPIIKWRPKPLNDAPGALAQLWTTYEWDDSEHKNGKMNYRLTLYKVTGKNLCEVQLLDDTGFKITEFNASDFYPIPGSTDLIEARESHPLSEEKYKRVQDYSIK